MSKGGIRFKFKGDHGFPIKSSDSVEDHRLSSMDLVTYVYMAITKNKYIMNKHQN